MSDDDSNKLHKDWILLSSLFFYLSILFLVFSVLSIGEAWFHALKDGWLPEEWDKWAGNHGPWRHYYPGGELIWRALNLQIISSLTAIISLLFKRSWRGIVLLVISVVVFFTTMGTHYWLVD